MNTQAANFINALMRRLMARGRKERKEEWIEFAREYLRDAPNEPIDNIEYEAENGVGGFGIIWNLIDLGKGE